VSTPHDDWPERLQAACEAIRARFGSWPRRLKVVLDDGTRLKVRAPLPAANAPRAKDPGGAPPAPQEVRCSADGGRLFHPDFGEVLFRGADQQVIVRALFEAGEGGVAQEELPAAAGSQSSKLAELFKQHARGPLVGPDRLIQNCGLGRYRLAPVGDPASTEE
jgi:hypothetical protein